MLLPVAEAYILTAKIPLCSIHYATALSNQKVLRCPEWSKGVIFGVHRYLVICARIEAPCFAGLAARMRVPPIDMGSIAVIDSGVVFDI